MTAEALSLRYRFIEKYSPTEDPNHPELITQYRVGIVETQKTESEKPQGAPDRAEISRHTIYTERAAQVGKLGEMSSAVRRYDKFVIKDVANIRSFQAPSFRGPDGLASAPDRPETQGPEPDRRSPAPRV